MVFLTVKCSRSFGAFLMFGNFISENALKFGTHGQYKDKRDTIDLLGSRSC